MNGFEELAMIMKSNNTKSSFAICDMLSPTSCKFNELLLDEEDLYIFQYLKTGYYTNIGGVMTLTEPLKTGDAVIVIKLSDEKYVIIGKVG